MLKQYVKSLHGQRRFKPMFLRDFAPNLPVVVTVSGRTSERRYFLDGWRISKTDALRLMDMGREFIVSEFSLATQTQGE